LLLEQLTSRASKRRYLETQERAVAIALVAEIPDFRRAFEHVGNATGCAARMQKAHANRVLQRIVQSGQDRADELGTRLLPKSLLTLDKERSLNPLHLLSLYSTNLMSTSRL